MDYPEDQTVAANYVREALPLMIKHKIPPNPQNFALWYAYVSKQNPTLMEELNAVISDTGTCSPELSSRLFFKHIINNDPYTIEEIGNTVSNMLDALVKETQNTFDSTQSFSDCLEENIRQFNEIDTDGKREQWLQNMLENTVQINNITHSFTQQLNTAQHEISQLKSQLEDTQRAAFIDPLTKVANRRAFQNSLNHFLTNPLESAAILLIDIDHFKQVNDNYGHNMGDSVLRAIATTIQEKLPQGHNLARYGGEEFAILLPNYSIEQAISLAEKIRISAANLIFRNKTSGEDLDKITVSIGLSDYQRDDSFDEWIERCDQALYRAKGDGRNQVCYFKDETLSA